MLSPSQRFALVINGEIYNHKELRAKLECTGSAPVWRGASDTEVLAAAIDAWGVEESISQCVGMFALAIWDRRHRQLVLARDRVGEKPLYLGQFGDTWLFGSELKALAAHPAFERTINRDAVATYMMLGYVPAPASIYENVTKLQPGCLVTIDAKAGTVQQRAYWCALRSASGARHVFSDDAQAIDMTEGLLSQAVAQQMVADRPVGALLSGGIDSSCIVALMSAAAPAPVKTFSIGFHESSFDEATYARAVARHFGTHHTELYATPADARAVIPLLPSMYDEPLADSSQIPTFMVAQLARATVTVALTGDGGDELFGGYPRYTMGSRLWPAIRRVPLRWRAPIGGLMHWLASSVVDRVLSQAFLRDRIAGAHAARPAQRLTRLGRVVCSQDLRLLYLQLLSYWAEPALLAPELRDSAIMHGVGELGDAAVADQFMLRDLLGYLPDDILVKTDRAAMAVSLETRAPFLDHRVVDFALRVPLHLKIRHGTSKWLLRQVLHRHIPPALVERPKMGFAMPLAAWLRGPLRQWAGDLIAAQGIEASTFLDRKTLSRMQDEHFKGTRDWHQALWAALMLLAWSADNQHQRVGSADGREVGSAIDLTAAPLVGVDSSASHLS